MGKSKFKTVKFLPFDRFLYEENTCFWRDVGMYHDIMFEEKFIENNKTLFEVEKAQRQFEHKAYYKVKINASAKDYEPAQYNGHTKGFYVIDNDYKYSQSEIFEIGERFEL